MKLPAFRLLALDSDLPRPSYAHKGDAGLDLRSRIDVIVPAGGHVLVPTGLAIAIPVGLGFQRSSQRFDLWGV